MVPIRAVTARAPPNARDVGEEVLLWRYIHVRAVAVCSGVLRQGHRFVTTRVSVRRGARLVLLRIHKEGVPGIQRRKVVKIARFLCKIH
jgi:hypothetical protein